MINIVDKYRIYDDEVNESTMCQFQIRSESNNVFFNGRFTCWAEIGDEKDMKLQILEALEEQLREERKLLLQ